MRNLSSVFQGIQDSLAAAFREREGAIEAILLAALSGSNALLIGPPGTGKSALFRAFLAHLSDARTFDTLVTKFSTEDSLFGPVKLSALKNDQWERATTGKLADVHAAFLDEFFKASDAALNTLLTAINERMYMGKRIPLMMTVAASNELPTDEGLAAIYDRFVVRDVVEYIDTDDVWVDLMLNPPEYAPSSDLMITVQDWQLARADVAAVDLSEKVVRALAKLRRALKEQGVVASDRRWIALTRVLRAAAWLDGRAEVTIDDFRVLRYGLWTAPEDREKVNAALTALDSGPVKRAIDIMDAALARYNARPADPAALRSAAPGIADALARAAEAVDAIRDEGVSTRAAERIGARRAELQTAWEGMTAVVARGVGKGLASLAAAGRAARA
jgi:MoxR-like ATPase